MAPYIFTEAALKNKIINQFGDGKSARDYTYVDDVLGGILKALDKASHFETINIGNSNPITLSDFIQLIENKTGKKIRKKTLPIRQEESSITFASIKKS